MQEMHSKRPKFSARAFHPPPTPNVLPPTQVLIENPDSEVRTSPKHAPKLECCMGMHLASGESERGVTNKPTAVELCKARSCRSC